MAWRQFVVLDAETVRRATGTRATFGSGPALEPRKPR